MEKKKSESHKISNWAWDFISKKAKKDIRSKKDTLDIIIKEWKELKNG